MNKSIGVVLVVAFLFRLTLVVIEMNFYELPDYNQLSILRLSTESKKKDVKSRGDFNF